MDVGPRHYCRNPRCRSKLPAPVENHHHAFCARGCYESFYRSRCLVCEDPMQRRREGQQIRSGHAKCAAEYRKFPHAFAFPVAKGQISHESLGSAHSTGTKFGLAGYPPARWCLRGWWWGDPGIGDLSLYDGEGLSLVRIVLKDGQWHLRSPLSWPCRVWPNLETARHGAEAIALASLALDPKIAARIAKDNTTPHPMGPPLNRQPVPPDAAIASGWKPTGEGVAPEIPEFLRRH